MLEKQDLEEQIMTTPQIQLQKPNDSFNSQPILIRERPRYGKMIIFFEKPFLFSIGPDYWCFLPTFAIFCTVSFFMTKFVLQNAENIYFKIFTILICGGMCLSYFLVATSNPGVVTEEDYADSQEQQNPMNQQALSRKKLCKKCNFRVKRSTYHCHDCDVCIRDYDHHCPWTSKCIGGGNLIRFYIFLAMVPTYLIFVFVGFAMLMSQIAIENATSHLKVHPR